MDLSVTLELCFRIFIQSWAASGIQTSIAIMKNTLKALIIITAKGEFTLELHVIHIVTTVATDLIDRRILIIIFAFASLIIVVSAKFDVVVTQEMVSVV